MPVSLRAFSLPVFHRTPTAPQSDERQTKIVRYFEKLQDAESKQARPGATRAFIATRTVLQKKQDERSAMHARDRFFSARGRELQKEISLLKKEQQRLYIDGPLGLSQEDVAAKRREQRKAAWIEGVHTLLGARVFTTAAGIAGPELVGAGEKAALHQSTGYAPQAVFSGLLRIVTEVPQIRLNRGGRPRLPANLAVHGGFRQNNKALKSDSKRLERACQNLSQAAEQLDRERPQPKPLAYHQLNDALLEVCSAMEHGERAVENDRNLWVMLEREFRGKKVSAIVSVIAGLASFGALAVDQTGIGPQVAHKLLCMMGSLLQIPSSESDFMDGSVDFPQRISSERIDCKLLLKPHARGKALNEIDDEDIDTSVASRLYDEQPQLVRSTLLQISLHAMGTLKREQLQLKQELANSKPPRLRRILQNSDVWRDKTERLLAEVEQALNELLHQHVMFEQRNGQGLDPDGLIGRAIREPVFFCLQGIRAGVFGKLGEAIAQINQRTNNNWNPMLSIGPASIALDVGQGVAGPHFVQDGIHSFDGSGPANPVAEQATLTIAGLAVLGSINSGVTVISARFKKSEHDRKALAAPDWITRGQAIAPAQRNVQIDQAYRTGVLSTRSARQLRKAVANVEQRGSDEVSQRTLRRLERFDALQERINATVESINHEWLLPQRDTNGHPLLDLYGNEIVIDLRGTSACLAHHVSRWTRGWAIVKGVGISMLESVRFWPDIFDSRHQRKRWTQTKAKNKVEEQIRNARLAASQAPASESSPEHPGQTETRSQTDGDGVLPPENDAFAAPSSRGKAAHAGPHETSLDGTTPPDTKE